MSPQHVGLRRHLKVPLMGQAHDRVLCFQERVESPSEVESVPTAAQQNATLLNSAANRSEVRLVRLTARALSPRLHARLFPRVVMAL